MEGLLHALEEAQAAFRQCSSCSSSGNKAHALASCPIYLRAITLLASPAAGNLLHLPSLQSAESTLYNYTQQQRLQQTTSFARNSSTMHSAMDVRKEILAAASNTVKHSCPSSIQYNTTLDNPFYLLAMCFVHMAKHHVEDTNSYYVSFYYLNCALKVFDHSPIVLFEYAKVLRVLAENDHDMDEYERLLKRAISACEYLEKLRNDQGVVGDGHESASVRGNENENDGMNDGESESKSDGESAGDSDDAVDYSDDDTMWLWSDDAQSEIDAAVAVVGALVLSLLQQSRVRDAHPLLKRLGASHTLSPCLLNYPTSARNNNSSALSTHSKPPYPLRIDIPLVKAFDGALPMPYLNHLRTTFAITSPFWTHHNYNPSTPYFSYTHPLSPMTLKKKLHQHVQNQKTTKLDSIISYIHSFLTPIIPTLSEATTAEWWAHARPHASAHQFHFDSDDEGLARVHGAPRHPIVSCVVVVDAKPGVGGPTIVTNQRLKDGLADRGWAVEPVVGRIVVFDGSVLHGVVPGKGRSADPNARRITFMIAFWKDIKSKPCPKGTQGTARPFPYGNPHNASWVELHDLPSSSSSHQDYEKENDCWGSVLPPPKNGIEPVIPVPIQPVWEAVDEIGLLNEMDVEDRVHGRVGNAADENESDCDDEPIDERELEIKFSTHSRFGLPPYEACFQGF